MGLDNVVQGGQHQLAPQGPLPPSFSQLSAPHVQEYFQHLVHRSPVQVGLERWDASLPGVGPGMAAVLGGCIPMEAVGQ